MMRININAFLVSILFIVICCVTLKGQQIWITPDVKVKNDFSFDILGKWPSKNTLIFRDKLFSFEIEAYNETMQFLWSKPLNLAKSKVNIIGISHVDTSFTVFFSYKRKDQTIIQAKTFNEHLKLLQTEKLFSSSNKFVNYSFRFTTSEDEKKVLIFYTVDRTNLHLLSFDVNNLYKTKPISIDMNTRRWKHHLEGISVSNEGFIFIVQDLSNIRKNKDKISVNCHRIAPDGLIVESLFQPENVYSEDVHYTYDNLHKKLVLAGTYKNKNNDWANGFWMLDVDNDLNEGQLNSYPFDDETLSEINGNSKQAFKGIKDLYIVELVQRKDGGTLILSEIQKEYSRRPDINPRLSETSFGVRRWIDYYYEDIILMSIHPSREQHWSTVMHKRQYSQDDEAVYSSFFLMKNPAMLKFIFNDEIRNSNTISEYVVTSRGLLERNSLMNTANLKLQLRLIDATQVGPNTILIPSQSNHQLNIVKMVF